MGLGGWVRNGNVRTDELEAFYPCDNWRPAGSIACFRAISVRASSTLVYRWLCQMQIAPYSYDWLDNRGKRSPRELTLGLDQISVGEAFLIFRTTEVAPGDHITGVASAEVEKAFGPISATYRIVARPDGTSRIVVKFWMGARGPLGRLNRAMLIAGDAVMMRKQLMTIRDLAERDARRAQAARRPPGEAAQR